MQPGTNKMASKFNRMKTKGMSPSRWILFSPDFLVINSLQRKATGYFYLAAFLLISFSAGAQVNSGPSVPDSVIEKRLVDLALQGPTLKQTEHQNKVYEYQLKNAKNAWMNLLTLSANYNDQTFRTTPTTAYVYPKYFFGLNIPLGTILSRTPVKAAGEAVAIGQLQQEEVRRRIKAEVLTKYRQYKGQTELIALELGLLNDIDAAFVQAEDKFRKNEISFEVYHVAMKAQNDQKARIINLKMQQDLFKLEIERMIGTSLESVLQ
jgi:outer membrane protein TolC